MGAHCAPLRQSNPTAVLIFSKQSPVSGMRQVKKQKEVGVKRVETIGVYPLAPRSGYGAPAGQASSVRFASDHSPKCEHFVKPVDIAE